MTLEEFADSLVTITDVSKPGNPRFRVTYLTLWYDCTDRDTAEMSARPIRRALLAMMQKVESDAYKTIVQECRDLMCLPLSDADFLVEVRKRLVVMRDRASDGVRMGIDRAAHKQINDAIQAGASKILRERGDVDTRM